ncbi:DUF3800 domain-containing protein [Actinoplanes sp. NPDC051343]|uniref:DUF3800 domain-containing protein n=1 Tax=Actinoplanes sp. NPDC051343 TaxID=3363906 RepID=UPI0037B7D542
MRRYLFSDESGNLDFARHVGASRYFSVATILIEEHHLAELRARLTVLRDKLAWADHGLDSYFHATQNDPQTRRDVLEVLAGLDFTVDVTLLDKPKAQPQTRLDHPTFYRYAWYYHLRHLAPRDLAAGDELMVVAAELGTRRTRKSFRDAIEGVMTEVVPYRVKRTLAFWPCSSDFALQAVDYCLWAVARKWETGDDTYYELIAPKVRTEFDLFKAGTHTYY